ncbi:ClpP family protease [Lewinella sp. LCG006]|uniref:ClpP family protease n=1 Tax=Lewinella sp. LCG006 TaxID=3231911 RepID=UPI0034612828
MNYGKEFQHFAVGHLGMSSMHLEDYLNKTNPSLNATISPTVIEERSLNMVQMDVFSRLMMDRIIFLGVPVSDYVANVIQAQLLFLQSTDPKRDIQMYINSPGGSVTAGLGIYDTMQYVGPDIATICTSISASMSAVLLAAGAHGKRSGLPHSRVMIHQPSGGMQGQVSDMEISYHLIKGMQKELYRILSEHTGQSYEQIASDSDRDRWMSAADAVAYGILDEVL